MSRLAAKHKHRLAVMRALAANEPGWGSTYAGIAGHTIDYGMQSTKRQVRLQVRYLMRQGLAEQYPVFDDDGMLAGSGSALTPRGRTVLALAEEYASSGGPSDANPGAPSKDLDATSDLDPLLRLKV